MFADDAELMEFGDVGGVVNGLIECEGCLSVLSDCAVSARVEIGGERWGVRGGGFFWDGSQELNQVAR